MRKLFILICSALLVAALMVGCGLNTVNDKSLQKFTIGDKAYTLEKGQELSANGWNEIEVFFDGEDYTELPEIYKGITIGDSYEEVLKAFDIKPGYAIVDMEVSTKEEDGTTDIIRKEYTDTEVFSERYLDLSLTFGYTVEDGEWTPVEYEELRDIMSKDKSALIYYVDFNGMDDEMVDKGQLISFSIRYQ